MERIRAIIECFLSSSFKEILSEETFSLFSITAEGNASSSVDILALQRAIEILPSGQWTLSIALEGQDSPHSLGSTDVSRTQEFLSDLAYGVALSADASLKFQLSKSPGLSHVDVIDPRLFFHWIETLPFPEALSRFDSLADEHPSVSFVHPTFDEAVATHFFRFANAAVAVPDAGTITTHRSELLAARREQIVSDWTTLNLLPDDFRWVTKGRIAPLEDVFAKLENFLGAVSLADSTTTIPNGFLVRVKSHVLREQSLAWSDVPAKPDIAIRNLFEWCYRASGAGPLPDKLGLVRNFISLYWDFGIFGQDLRVMAAVRSGYSLYLKRNLKEFVELRAKVASFILEIDAKAAKSVETVTGNLEKNFYGLTTFITSVVLLKVLQDKTFSGAFTPQLALLGAALILVSAVHAVFARQSALKEMQRANALYDDLRKLYSAFFSPTDFDSIFRTGDKSPIQKTEDYIRSRLRSLLWVWFATLGIAGGLIYILRHWK
jgi:hypothetical protein